ncbi:MAG: hypothetical protein LBC96_07485 [Lachnospiraceae bacterium]|jgi:hypothetical protein|nr:hypothetical protein [Lachnospiraceae bacterium]
MNINYHYYTIKTLARHAGFNDEDAQYIAYFSQEVDNFILSSPLIVDVKPPEFFFKHKLAHKLGKDKWVFMPCPTGINVAGSITGRYQQNTLMPFHFLMPVPYNMSSGGDRRVYRCLPANHSEDLLINRMVKRLIKDADVSDKNTLMALGMLLHTYADTYAHCWFSGFYGWENKLFVSEMKHRNLRSETENVFVKIWRGTMKLLLGKKEPFDGMTAKEIALFQKLPPIGHGRVASAPDYCDCTIILSGKRTEAGEPEPLVERDNMLFFADCSRRILDMLCQVKKQPLFNDDEWETLQEKLGEAQNVREQTSRRKNKKKWSETFPDIEYSYNKHEFMKLKLEVLQSEKDLPDEFAVKKSELTDIYSPEGDHARSVCFTLARNVDDVFYKFNEIAYNHVFTAVGHYATNGALTDLIEYCELALSPEGLNLAT